MTGRACPLDLLKTADTGNKLYGVTTQVFAPVTEAPLVTRRYDGTVPAGLVRRDGKANRVACTATNKGAYARLSSRLSISSWRAGCGLGIAVGWNLNSETSTPVGHPGYPQAIPKSSLVGPL